MGWWQRVQATLGGSKRQAPAAVSTLPSVPLTSQFVRIGGSLTPARVSSILRLADDGYTYELVDLGNEARQKDNHLNCVLQVREGALGQLELRVQPSLERGAKEATLEQRRATELVQDAFAGATGLNDEVVSLDRTIEHLQGAPFWGYALAETIWQKRSGLLMPAGFICHSPRRFGFDDHGRLVQWDQSGALGGGVKTCVQEKWPGRWVQHQPRVTGDVPAREGLVRSLMWAALFRSWTIADWMRLAELSWKPWREGIYEDGASTDDIDALEDMLDKLSAAGVATHSKRTDLKIHFPVGMTGIQSQHRELAAFMGEEISKAVLGQTLTTEAGVRGARSLGDVHDRIRRDIRDRDATAMAATLRRDLASWVVRLNLGDAAPVPLVWFDTAEPIDLLEYGQALSALTDAGLRVPAAHVYSMTGVPAPEDDEEVLGGAAPVAAPEPESESSGEVEVDLTEVEEPAAEPVEPAEE